MTLLDITPAAQDYWTKRRSVVGAFFDIDFLVFDRILRGQSEKGDLLEIGALYGKSAILMGLHARADETVHICDVFENPTSDEANELENSDSYPGLTRDLFESNYKAYLSRPPHVIQELSDTIAEHVDPGTLRFAHVDGGHLYETVRSDIANVRDLLLPGGVVVLDDFRAIHTPGVAAAAWAAVENHGLRPFATTEQKLYASWDAATADKVRSSLTDWAQGTGGELHHGTQMIGEHQVLIMTNPIVSRARHRVGSLIPPAVRHALRGAPRPPHLGH